MSEQAGKPHKDRTAVELFAGGGGLAMAVHRAGFRPLLFNEFHKHACRTLVAGGAEPRGDSERVPEPGGRAPLVEGDVRGLSMKYLNGLVDVVAGGPPCQPFSLGGVAKGDEDKRNMFPEMFRAIREIGPKAVVCENVKGLLRPSFKPYFDYILRELELPFEERQDTSWEVHDKQLRERLRSDSVDPRERYNVVVTKVNAADYGVPQIRHRIIIVAFRSDLQVDLKAFTEAVRPRYSETALIRSMVDGRYWAAHPKVPKHVRAAAMGRLPAAVPLDDGMKPWRTLRDAIYGAVDEYGQPREPLPRVPWNELDRVDRKPRGFMDHIGWPDARIYDGHTPNYLDRPAKTVKAGVHGVPGGESVMLTDSRVHDEESPTGWRYQHRYMTVRETARVMTFPDDRVLCGPRGEQMRQLGNAVPVLLGEVFAKAVADALNAAEGL